YETVSSGNNTSKLVSKIVKPILYRRTSISFHQLLEIVKPEINQELINAIANPDIS
ncbi:12594_t:CDS:1, partial [Gigaspora rosea]